MSDSLEDDWKDVRPGPEVPEHPPEPPTPPAPSLAERARALHEALILLAEITQCENKPEFEIKIGGRLPADFTTKTKHTSIGQALEDLTGQINAQIECKLKYARDRRDSGRDGYTAAEAELTRVETLVREARKA